ncbi:MAG: hypothetical protein IT579_16900 [Verrucomicrobia subdivision 3 bacterium]|nr:hypothetical protein [Limisphaerales bacterium]
MTTALFYLWQMSVRNRLVTRFKRLRQPKYLAGAIVGGLYFYFYFFRWMFLPHGSGHGPTPEASTPLDPTLRESIGALILFGIVLLAWIVPRKRAALAFTEAEIAFLFPAPISRSGLVHFKLLRSQASILFMAIFFALVSRGFRGDGRCLVFAAGWWIVLSTLNLHLLGASFVRTMLLDRGISHWMHRLFVIGLALAAFGAAAAWTVHSLPPLTDADLTGRSAIEQYLRQALVSGPLPYVLFPFRLVVRPYLAATGIAFLHALGPAALLLVAHYWWVIRSDVAFAEASLEASQKLAEKVAAVRAGNWQNANQQHKVKRPPFTLRPVGWPAVALLWKNLIAAGQGFTARLWIILLVSLTAMAVAMRGVLADGNWLAVAGMFTLAVGIWALLIGPQIVRQDFRQDLPQADVLKALPLRGWQVALGEILAPIVILTAIHWLLLTLAVVCLSLAQSLGKWNGLVWPIGIGTAMILPALNAISLLIPNAAVLLFPSWFQLGRDATQGIEATGQRLIFALGQFLAFAIALLPAALVFTLVLFAVKSFAGLALAVPAASAATAIVLAVEAGLGVLLLGWLFERFDVSAEQSP